MNIFDNLSDKSKVEKASKLTFTGKLLIGITGGFAIGLTVICAPFVSPALRKFCLPYIPATTEQVKNVFIALANNKGKLIDLGSGDGRIVIDASKQGFESHGVELNAWLILYAKLNALRQGCNVKFFRQDLWNFNLKSYNYIVIFGVEQMMHELEKKLISECNRNCKIIACRFPLPDMLPVKTIGSGINTVWLYDMSQIKTR